MVVPLVIISETLFVNVKGLARSVATMENNSSFWLVTMWRNLLLELSITKNSVASGQDGSVVDEKGFGTK